MRVVGLLKGGIKMRASKTNIGFNFLLKTLKSIILFICFGFTMEIFSADMLVVAMTKVGEAVYQRGGGKETPITKGQVFDKKDKIITKNGFVDLQVGLNSIIRVAKNSTLSLSELIEEVGSQKVELNLDKGTILAKTIKKMDKKSELKIITPTITAGVRGTQFLIQEGEDNLSTEEQLKPGVYVKEGAVDLKTDYSPDTIAIEAGQELVTSQKNLQTQILSDYAREKMKILDTLNAMKEANYKQLQEQRAKNKDLMKK